MDMTDWKNSDLLTDSLWLFDKRDSSGAHKGDFHGNFIPQIPNQMIRRFTKPGDLVLDSFCGSGTTAIEAQRLGRDCLCLDINQEMVDMTERRVIEDRKNIPAVSGYTDVSCIDNMIFPYEEYKDKVQLAILHPPYWDIIKFSEKEEDYSNCKDVGDFYNRFNKLLAYLEVCIKEGGYLVLVIGDVYKEGEVIPLGSQLMDCVRRQCFPVEDYNFLDMRCIFKLKGIIVKDFNNVQNSGKNKNLWRYRALKNGFYVFKHEYIYVFQKQPDIIGKKRKRKED